MLEDITGQRFGRLTVIKFDHKNKYHIRFFLCKCDCGNYKVVSYSNLKLGRTKSCGCLHREKLSKDITGKRFNHLVAMNLDHYEHGRAYWKFMCDCGNEVIYELRQVTVQHKQSCGCELLEDLTGKRYGKLTVLEYAYSKNKKRYWKCKCDCGSIVYDSTNALNSGNSTSCGCNQKEYKDITGNKYGKLIAEKYLGKSMWLCKCDCGNYTKVLRNDLETGSILSCGCNNISKYGSKEENEIKSYIENKYPQYNIIKTRSILDGLEIDMYISELKIGIEYNGSPYHATEGALFRNKDKYYHRDKFLLAKSKGIHLLNVFDIDYKNNKQNVLDKISDIIENKQKSQPTTDIFITDNDYDDGSWLKNYVEVEQIEPEYFIYQNKYKVYRCGKTLYIKSI